MAIKEWIKLKEGQPVPLERAIAAFDMFVLHGRKGDFNDVCTPKLHIEDLAAC